jgi:predicted nucleic acid-binding protein
MKLLDTTVVIDIDRGGSEVLYKARKLDRTGTHALSVVTQYEFYWGIFRRYQKGSKKYEEAMDKVEMMFSRFHLLPVTPDIAIKAAEIGTYLISIGREVDIMDTYIASTAILHRLALVTANKAHFEEIDDLKIKNW